MKKLSIRKDKNMIRYIRKITYKCVKPIVKNLKFKIISLIKLYFDVSVRFEIFYECFAIEQ